MNKATFSVFSKKHVALILHTWVVILIFFFCPIIDLNAQSPDKKIDPDNVNIEYPEHLVKTRVNSFRQSHSQYPLVNDSILYLVAKHHANYLVKNNILNHFEKNV